MKRIFIAVCLYLIVVSMAFAQSRNPFDANKATYKPAPTEVTDMFNATGSAGAMLIWNSNFSIQPDGTYLFRFRAPLSFTAFGVGWDCGNTSYPASAFEITYRAAIQGSAPGKWYSNDGYVHATETPTNLYWTDLLFLDNETPHHYLELYLKPPAGVQLQSVRISLMDMTGTDSPVEKSVGSTGSVQNCPPMPTVITRTQWCGSYSACHNTTSYTNISPTHTVVHHGASPDTYTDGATVVRGYWNYHVNTLGWSDIGYNYLFDKAGNMYQGRHNPNMPNTDVRGAHAGSANDGSIGINFLGNADVTLPTTAQLDKLKAFFAWWYDHKGLDPTSSAGMTTQAFGWQVKPRICGHKDVGQTSCPGNTLYAHLPAIRTGTKSIIDACGTVTPTGPANLQIALAACPNSSFTCSWTNSGTGWYIQVSAASDYSNPYYKYVSGLTTYTGPAGFVLQSNGTTPLSLIMGTTYYWRIWDGTTFTVGPSFTIPFCDTIPPSSLIATQGNWKTQDFTATFTDTDNSGGSGVASRFYQVLDFNGTHWYANGQRGFFGDNFDVLATSLWTIPSSSGTWNIQNGALVQTDEAVNNSNIYASINQTLSNRYLYHFSAKVEGAGHTNGRRFGFHYFCDDASQNNRGNSYFIWFRVETDKLEFYKVTNNVFTMVDEIDDVVTVPGVTYDYKVIYDRITGDHYVYRNDILIGYWKDTAPLSANGNHISFRSGNCKLSVNELKVYRTRAASANITLGGSASDIRFQNPAPNIYGAKIKSIVMDNAGLMSPIAFHDLNIDWTLPETITTLNDGTNQDIDTTASYSELSAVWNSSTDTQSGIADYWYAIGTAPGDSNIVNWTSNVTDTAVTHSGLNLIFNTVYYFSVRARNNAGLLSPVITSDGQLIYNTSAILAANFLAHSNSICESDSIMFSNQSIGAVTFEWLFQGGNPPLSTASNPVVAYDSAGVYNVELRVFDSFGNSDTLALSQYITVHPRPRAAFSAIDTILYLPQAVAYFINTSTYTSAWFWSFGDSYISTDASPWHQYTAPGIYSVGLVAFNPMCRYDTLIKANYIQVLDPNSIEENSNFAAAYLTGNAGNGSLILHLNLKNNDLISIGITDILGRYNELKASEHFDAGTHTIPLPQLHQLAQGLYYIVVRESTGHVSTVKCIVN